MKLSKYNTVVKIDDENVIYNTYSRKYVIYKNDQEEHVNNLFSNLNNDKYNLKDAESLKKFINNGMVIEDELDELLRIKFNDNLAKFDSETFSLVIQPTLDCNFRCVYCYEEHKKSSIENQTKENIIKFIDKISRKSKNIRVAWFGGEPMLEIDTIIALTLKFKELCIKNGCNYEATMTTNGYLFSDDNIDILQQLSVNQFQITLDGTKECHDKKRPLSTGERTFEKIIKNIIKILNKNIKITLRINVDEENYEYIDELLDMIPEEKRAYVNINMSNLF